MRTQARKLSNSKQSQKALFGIFLVMAPLLLGEKQLFDHLPFERFTNLLIEVLTLALSFGLTWFLFLRPGKLEDETEQT